MDTHTDVSLFDREGKPWPDPVTTAIDVHLIFKLRSELQGYDVRVVIVDATTGQDLEWSSQTLDYSIGAWAQAMALTAWQLERGSHHLHTFP